MIPIVGVEYTQETLFARLDEDDTNLVTLNFIYDRDAQKECGDVILLNEHTPTLGEQDYVLQWEPVEGAEFYQVLWNTPSRTVFYYNMTDPEFGLSQAEGLLDEAGEHWFCIIPYGDGRIFTYDWWACVIE